MKRKKTICTGKITGFLPVIIRGYLVESGIIYKGLRLIKTAQRRDYNGVITDEGSKKKRKSGEYDG